MFVAGATGAVGRTVVRLGAARDVALVPHARPRHQGTPQAPPGAVFFELDDRMRLVESLRGCTTVLQLVGTMRKRFAAGDTYETSDVGTTRALIEAAREAGTIDHVVLLSSVGAGAPVGAYLKAKARAEAIVRESGIAWTILRPSAFDGEGHRAPAGLGVFAALPGLGRFKPITVDTLAGKLLDVALARAPLEEVLEGRELTA